MRVGAWGTGQSQAACSSDLDDLCLKTYTAGLILASNNTTNYLPTSNYRSLFRGQIYALNTLLCILKHIHMHMHMNVNVNVNMNMNMSV